MRGDCLWLIWTRNTAKGAQENGCPDVTTADSNEQAFEILEAKLRYIVSELRRCQLANGGRWAASIPEKYFEIMTTGVYIWSPQYTVHKLLMGLLDTYKYTGNKEALVILSGMVISARLVQPLNVC